MIKSLEQNIIAVGGWRFLPLRRIISFLWIVWGLFIGLAFAPFEIVSLIWILPLPLAFCSLPISAKRAWRYGFCFGFGYFLISLFWLHTVTFCGLFVLTSICAFFYGLWFGFIYLAEKYLKISDTFKLFIFSAMWITQDFLRAHIFTGFPWNFPGIAVWQNPDVGIIRLGGVYAQTFLIIFVGLFITSICRNLYQKKKFIVKDNLINFLFALSLGLLTYFCNKNVNYDELDKEFSILSVQGNVPLARDFSGMGSDDQLNETLKTYVDLTIAGIKKNKAEKFDLIVWAETAIPAPLFNHRNYYYSFLDLLKKVNKPFLIGNVEYRQNPQNPTDLNDFQMLNTAVLLRRDLRGIEKIQTYAKTHPVPFGEFIPFGDFLSFLRDLSGVHLDLTAGTEFVVFNEFSPAKFGINICFEDVFPDISRKFMANGANMIWTITNDAWYHESSGSRQHFSNSIFRAIENNVCFFRSGNRSYTSVTLPSGKTIELFKDLNEKSEQKAVFVAEAKVLKIPYTENPSKTFYAKFGDIFAWICSLITIFSLIFAFYNSYHLLKKLRKKLS